MPKITIAEPCTSHEHYVKNDRTDSLTVSPDGGDSLPDGYLDDYVGPVAHAVHVGWAKDRDVQLSVGLAYANAPGEFTQVSPADVDTNPAAVTQNDAHFMTLDRAGINRLIRGLRQARDAAYGADA